MTAPIDPAGREAELRALADAATPGEWSEMCMGSEGYFVFEVAPSTGYKRRRRVAACTNESWEIDKANAAFIAASREAVPWLLDRLAEERKKVDRLQRQVDAVRAETLREAADEVHREARWQQEMILRGQGQHIQSVGRLLVVESILLNRAAALDAVQPETEER